MAEFRRASSSRTAVVAGDAADSRSDVPGDPDQELGDPVEVARLICLNQLETRPRSRAELAQTLRKRGVPEDAAEQVLCRFTEVGLIDDAAFAEMWVRSRSNERGLAKAVLRQELFRKGIDPEIAAGALEQLAPGTEAAAARALVAKKLRQTQGLPVETRMRRLVGMLARKGYGSSLAFVVVKEALEAEAAEEGYVHLGLADVHLESGQD